MSTRAKLTITAFGETTEYSINLGSEKDSLPRARNDFLYRAALTALIPAALERTYGRKTTFVTMLDTLGQPDVKYADKGKTFTAKGMVINPIHGRDNCFEQKVAGKVILTFSLPEVATQE